MASGTPTSANVHADVIRARVAAAHLDTVLYAWADKDQVWRDATTRRAGEAAAAWLGYFVRESRGVDAGAAVGVIGSASGRDDYLFLRGAPGEAVLGFLLIAATADSGLMRTFTTTMRVNGRGPGTTVYDTSAFVLYIRRVVARAVDELQGVYYSGPKCAAVCARVFTECSTYAVSALRAADARVYGAADGDRPLVSRVRIPAAVVDATAYHTTLVHALSNKWLRQLLGPEWWRPAARYFTERLMDTFIPAWARNRVRDTGVYVPEVLRTTRFVEQCAVLHRAAGNAVDQDPYARAAIVVTVLTVALTTVDGMAFLENSRVVEASTAEADNTAVAVDHMRAVVTQGTSQRTRFVVMYERLLGVVAAVATANAAAVRAQRLQAVTVRTVERRVADVEFEEASRRRRAARTLSWSSGGHGRGHAV